MSFLRLAYDFLYKTALRIKISRSVPPVSPPASGVNDFRGVTGGVYKARERIHRSMLTCDY